MALIQCRECGQSVSTEAVACPHCGAPQQRPVPPLLPVQPQEQKIYSDNVVAVTTTRVIIGGATYALRNITSVKMTYTCLLYTSNVALNLRNCCVKSSTQLNTIQHGSTSAVHAAEIVQPSHTQDIRKGAAKNGN